MSISEHWLALGFVAFIALIGLAGNGDYQEEINKQASYCEMVKLFQDTNGENGWPDYEKKAASC
jgi:hypothetical protein